MLIKFNKKDPRSGMVVRMDSSRAYQFIDAGIAEQVPENAPAEKTVVAPQNKAVTSKSTKAK